MSVSFSFERSFTPPRRSVHTFHIFAQSKKKKKKKTILGRVDEVPHDETLTNRRFLYPLWHGKSNPRHGSIIDFAQ